MADLVERLPPQSREAEQSVIGSMLVDRDAIAKVIEILQVADFYIPAHRDIYQAVQDLFAANQPVDMVTVGEWLRRRDLLERIGGISYLADLAGAIPITANVEAYARIVEEKSVLRQLIHSGQQIVTLAYEEDQPIGDILDRAEKAVFAIGQKRRGQDLIHIRDIIHETFDHWGDQEEGKYQQQVPSAFVDLDTLLGGGLTRSDLIVLAARPSMGKCLSASSEIVGAGGSVATIEEIYNRRQAKLLTLHNNWKFEFTKPSAFVDDGIKPVFRVTTRLGRYVESTLTHPFLTLNGWQKLSELRPGDKIAVPRRIPVFGPETMNEGAIKVLAYLIGDGCLTKTCPEFTNGNPRLQEEFSQAVASFAGTTVHFKKVTGNRTPTLQVTGDSDFIATHRKNFGRRLKELAYSRCGSLRKLAQTLGVAPSLMTLWTKGTCVPRVQLFERLCEVLHARPEELVPFGHAAISRSSQNPVTLWLSELGLWGKDAHSKEIPSIVFRLKRPQIALFLNRLFATDGWASVLASGQAQLGCSTVSERLARHVQHLLLRFGVIASLEKRMVKYLDTRRCSWQLDITDAPSIRTFLNEIGIWGKEESLAAIRGVLDDRKFHTNRDLVPLEIWEQVAAAKGEESWAGLARRAGLKGYTNIHVGQRSLTRERLLTLATALADPLLQELAQSDVYWDEIVSIEYVGDKQVYDLTIPDTHNFIANDICVHNTALSLNIACKLAMQRQLPVAIFSLEMAKEQLMMRLLCLQGRLNSLRLRLRNLSAEEFVGVNQAAADLSTAPIYIDDSSSLSAIEIRAKSRRLKAELGDLGLIVVDYLQLMEANTGRGDNRVQEISQITRSLKGLARELRVPVLALSQLSRKVEERTDKRPMLSDLRESGCLAGETPVLLPDEGVYRPIKELVGQTGFRVLALNERTWKLEPRMVSKAFATGFKPVYKIATRLGRLIRATGNHKFLTIHGWRRLDELSAGIRLALPRQLPSPGQATMTDAELALLGHLIGDGCTLPTHAIQYTTREHTLAVLVSRLASEVFGEGVIPRIARERRWYQVYLAASQRLTHNKFNPVARWLRDLGIFGLRSHEKRIPEKVFSQPVDGIARFLRHLWATDGCIHLSKGQRHNTGIYYASSSIELCRNVQSLLLRLGINAILSCHPQVGKGRDQYHVIISGKSDIETFFERVGALGEQKVMHQEAISAYLESRSANTNRDVLPREVWRMLAVPAMQAAGITARGMQAGIGNAYCGTTLYKQNVSRERGLRVARFVESRELVKLAQSDVYWDEIVSLEPDGEEAVYDLTVEQLHNFVAGDILVHNSIEQDSDVVLFIYRDDYYHPSDQSMPLKPTELLIAKHRNGPTGRVYLMYQSDFMRFENASKEGIHY